MSTGAEPCDLAANAAALEAELAWLEGLVTMRIGQTAGQAPSGSHALPTLPSPPQHAPETSALGAMIADAALGTPERIALALALAPHLRPELLDPLLLKNTAIDRGFTEFGGRTSRSHSGFLPTGETLAFLAAGSDLAERLTLRALFAPSHVFQRDGLVRLDHDTPGEPWLSGALVCPDDTVSRLATGTRAKPDFNADFPAQLLTTRLNWSDLVLGAETMDEIDTITGWIVHGDAILGDWDFARFIRPGYRCLFYGPPGTGKTLTATLLGQQSQRDVYRIDLSMIVSKYIGETEKNLGRVFDRAENEDWILFFDEADALFGKRTTTSSAHDRYANQEVSYLLQRIEDFAGFVILATNLKGNIDAAFARRFQSIVHFPMPDARQRLALWEGVLRDRTRICDDVNLRQLSEQHAISGGAIGNVVRFAAIQAARAGRHAIAAADLSLGIVKELRKEGRTI